MSSFVVLRLSAIAAAMLLLCAGDVERNPGPFTVLTKEDVALLVEKLANYASKWRDIGLQLGFTVPELDTIYASPPGQNARHYLTSILNEWVHWTPTSHRKYATLEDLESTLRSDTVNLGTIADVLHVAFQAKSLNLPATKRHRTNTETDSQTMPPIQLAPTEMSSYHSQNVAQDPEHSTRTLRALPHRISNTLRSQFRDQRDVSGLSSTALENLGDTLFERTKRIISQFDILVSRTFTSLEERQITARALKTDVIMFGKTSNPKQLKECHVVELDSATSVRDVQKCLFLKKYISFINYDILEKIIKAHGVPEDKQRMEAYISEFKNFCKCSVFEVPPHVIEEQCPNSADKKFVVKVSDEYFSDKEDTHNFFSMNDLIGVQRKIKKIVGCSFIFIRGIKKGCVEITFLTFKTLAFSESHLKELSKLGLTVINDAPSRQVKTLCKTIVTKQSSHKEIPRKVSEMKFPKQFPNQDTKFTGTVNLQIYFDSIPQLQFIMASQSPRESGQSDMHKSPPPSKQQKLDPLKDIADTLVEADTQPEEAPFRRKGKKTSQASPFCEKKKKKDFSTGKRKPKQFTHKRTCFKRKQKVSSKLSVACMNPWTTRTLVKCCKVRVAKFTKRDIYVKRYALYLKGVYTSANTSSDKFPHISFSEFINLALVKKERVSRLSADEFTRATLHGHVDEILKKKEPIKLEEVLNPTEGQPDMKCIFLEGAPGIGKSTCVWELCRRWDDIGTLKKYSLVVLVRLRDKQVQEAKSVENLCYHRNAELKHAVAAKIEACEGRGVLFILDGFDELPASLRRRSVFVELIKGTYLSHCTVLVTSRPSATADFQKVARCQIHKQIEVVGFTQDQIEEYARAAFASQPDVLADFLTYISTNPAIRSMMYIPLNSAIVVDIYRYNRTANRPIPRTMTQLYVELSLTLLARHLGEDDPLANQLPQRLEDLPLQLYRPFYALAELAFEGLARKEVVFHQVPDSLEHFGFMNSPTDLYLGRKASMSCSFLHLTLQEFLAAFYISQLSPSDQKSVFEKYCGTCWDMGWDVVWRFVAGLTGFSGIGWELVEAKRGREKRRKMLPFFTGCLYEAQEKVNLASVLGENEVGCVVDNGTALDIYAVGYCVANSKCMWKLTVEGSDDWLGCTLVEMLKHGLTMCSTKHVNILELKFNIYLEATALDKLADIIPRMTNLRKLDTYIRSEKDGCVNLFRSLTNLKNFQALTLREIDFGFRDIKALSRLISPSSGRLEELFIYANMSDADEEYEELIFKTLLSLSSLKSVEVQSVNWTDQAKRLLEENTNLRCIEFWLAQDSNDIQSLNSICEALHKNSHLKKLTLDFNDEIWPQSYEELNDIVSSLSTMLEINNSLEYLSIQSGGDIVMAIKDCNDPELSSMFKKLSSALQQENTRELQLIEDKIKSKVNAVEFNLELADLCE